jgi:hypothetical protein
VSGFGSTPSSDACEFEREGRVGGGPSSDACEFERERRVGVLGYSLRAGSATWRVVEFSNSNRYVLDHDGVGPRNMDCGSLLEELTPDPVEEGGGGYDRAVKVDPRL